MKFVAIAIGILLIVGGLTLVLTPIPVGLMMIFAGIVTIIVASARARKFFKWARGRFKWLDRLLDRAKDILPERVARKVEETRPDPAPDEPKDTALGAIPVAPGETPPRRTLLARRPASPRYHAPARPRG